MAKLNHNQAQTNKSTDSAANIEMSFWKKLTRRRNRKIAGAAAIFAIIVFHFTSQFVFFRSENLSPSVTGDVSQPVAESKTEVRREALIKTPEYEVKPPTSVKVQPIVQPKEAVTVTTTTTKTRIAIKKREMQPEQRRDSRADRLRRAEKMLTGV